MNFFFDPGDDLFKRVLFKRIFYSSLVLTRQLFITNLSNADLYMQTVIEL